MICCRAVSILVIPLMGCACLPTGSITLCRDGAWRLIMEYVRPHVVGRGGSRDCDALIAVIELAWK